MECSAQPFTLSGFPRAILHVDGDAFFTSVEQALHPAWKGVPLVTGKERGIIACASYEAKALGIKRGIRLHEAQRMCPELIVLPSDYETYSLFSKRMFCILRRFTPMVEESSIDEGFADLTGLRRPHHTSYEEIARRIKQTIQDELGLTVSAGLSLSKGLAKLASKFRKPSGFTAVAGYHIHLFLQRHALDDVWGFGPNTSSLLQKHGLRTALDFATRTEAWAGRLLGKVGREIWHELRGEAVYPLVTEEKTDYATISKCKTFTAPSADRDFVYARLVRNVESACIKLRRHRLRARQLTVALRRRDFSQAGVEARLTRATSAAPEMLPLVHEMFERLYEPGTEYRTAIVVMAGLEEDRVEQGDLFEDRVRIDKMEQLARAVDVVAERFGKHKLSLGPALALGRHRVTERDAAPQRKQDLLPGETARQRIAIPWLRVAV
jgi:DNA polymerase IV